MWIVVSLAGVALLASHAWWWWRLRRLRADHERSRVEHRSTEARLSELIERDQLGHVAVLNCLLEGLVVLGADGRVRLVNEPLRHLFGLTDDVRGRTLLECLGHHELEDLARRAREKGRALGFDFQLELRGRPPLFLQVDATTFVDGPGPARGIILIFRDVTRLKELERNRREFVANVSHELRTPLALIKGYVETLIDGARHDADVGLRFLQTIEKHTNRLTFLIEDLLTISQLEAGQVVLNRQWGELRPLVSRVIEDFTARAAVREIQLLNEVPAEIQVRVDFDRLQQVLFNVIDNAIKYGSAGGKVTIGARLMDSMAPSRAGLASPRAMGTGKDVDDSNRLEGGTPAPTPVVATREEAGATIEPTVSRTPSEEIHSAGENRGEPFSEESTALLELWVSDDGPGIPPESLERVFERFYRVDAARSREQGGTGLGLSIVKHIVQAHGGEVRAESEPGRGTTFRMTLPSNPRFSTGG